MIFIKFYRLGNFFPIKFSISSLDKKLKIAEFPYSSKAIVGLIFFILFLFSFLIFGAFVLSNYFWNHRLNFVFTFLFHTFVFAGFILPFLIYKYPIKIFYTKKIVQYNEELLKILIIISKNIRIIGFLDSFLISIKKLDGSLKTKFDGLYDHMKNGMSLNQASQEYKVFLTEINPEFLKILEQIEIISKVENSGDKKNKLDKIKNSIITNFYISRKNNLENLLFNENLLLFLFVLIPNIFLIFFPFTAIFMPGLFKTSFIAYLFIIFFPGILLYKVMINYSRRIKTDVMGFWQKSEYHGFSIWLIIGCVSFACFIMCPAIMHLYYINMAEFAYNEYNFSNILICLCLGLGLSIAIIILSIVYCFTNKQFVKIEQKNESFSSFLKLDESVKTVLPNMGAEYISSTLSRTARKINTVAMVLIPFISAAAILMSMTTVKSLVYIEAVLSSLGGIGSSQKVSLGLVHVEEIIPPTILVAIISIYLIEIILILTIFSNNIKNGSNNLELMKTIGYNLFFGFLIFSILLIVSYYGMEKFIFGQFFAAG